MRSFTAPSSSRSRDTVAWVAMNPSSASRSTSSAWLVTPWFSSSCPMKCCRCAFVIRLLRPASSMAGPQEEREDAADGVHAVRGLWPHQRLRALDHGLADLLAAMGGKAVQEHGAIGGGVHQRVVHLEALEG